MEGIKTQAIEASGLSAVFDAIPGMAIKEGSSVKEQTGFSGDALVSGLSDGISTHLGLQMKNPFLQTVTYHSSQFVLLELAQFMFDGVSGFSAGNTLGFSIAQLKEMMKDVLQKLDIILDEPEESCSIFMEKALESIENGYCKDANDHFKEVVKKAIKGLSYATKNIKPEGMISVTRLMIIAELSIATYNSQEDCFDILENLTEKQRARIYSVIRTNLDRLIDALKTLKKKGLFSNQKSFDAENQDALDILLRKMVPIMLDFQPKNSMPSKTRSDNIHQIVLFPPYIPEGIEDAVSIEKQNLTVAVWKNEVTLCVFYNGDIFSGDIMDNTKDILITVDTAKAEASVDNDLMKQHPLEQTLIENDLKNIINRNNANMMKLLIGCRYVDTEYCLMQALKQGSVGCVEVILQNKAININRPRGNYGFIPLAFASANGKSDVVKLLIQNYGADVNMKDQQGYSALTAAIAFNHVDAVKMLLKMGADRTNVKQATMLNTHGITMLGVVKSGNAGWNEMKNYIKSQGIRMVP